MFKTDRACVWLIRYMTDACRFLKIIAFDLDEDNFILKMSK